MKLTFITSILLLFSTVITYSYTYLNDSQESSDTAMYQKNPVYENIESAMQSADANKLSKHFNQEIRINVKDQKKVCDRKTAIEVMSSFFLKYPPKNFKFIHHGSSQKGVKFSIAKYTHEQGDFVIYILMNNNNDTFLIETIDIGGE